MLDPRTGAMLRIQDTVESRLDRQLEPLELATVAVLMCGLDLLDWVTGMGNRCCDFTAITSGAVENAARRALSPPA